MKKPDLKEVAENAGVVEPESKGVGRPVGAVGNLPALKSMTKKALESELGKARKQMKVFESDLAAVKQGAPGTVLTPEMLGVVPLMAYDVLALRFGEHWRLKEPEAVAYGTALSGVLDRYLSVLSGDYPEIFGLVLVAASVTTPRIIETFKVKAKDVQKPVKPTKKVPVDDGQAKTVH